MGEFSIWHWLVIAFIALLFFGPSRVEGLGKSLGRAIRGFKDGMNEMEADAKPVNDPDKQIKNTESSSSQGQTQSNKEKQNS
ncbi:MAG: Sec-independent protein translocase subunit TatA [Bdellovibrionaceae bacterium]|nr:Sec-independent protein translocase subunit TatA [Pseudobdellovibrionaceae bacterium]